MEFGRSIDLSGAGWTIAEWSTMNLLLNPRMLEKSVSAWKKTHQQSAAVEEVNKKDVAVWISN